MKKLALIATVLIFAFAFLVSPALAQNQKKQHKSIFKRIWSSPGVVVLHIAATATGLGIGAILDDDGAVWTYKIIGSTVGFLSVPVYKTIIHPNDDPAPTPPLYNPKNPNSNRIQKKQLE